MIDQRQSPRILVDVPAVLSVVGAASVCSARVLDVSKSGYRVNCPFKLESGTEVRLICLAKRILGKVRYSRQIESHEFHVGVEVTEVSTDGLSRSEPVDLTLIFQSAPAR